MRVVIAFAEDPLEVAVQIFYVRGGRIRGQRGWVADRVRPATPAAGRGLPPPAVRRRGGRHHPARDPGAGPAAGPPRSLEQLLGERRGVGKVHIRVPQRGDKKSPAGDRRPQRRAGAGAAQDQARQRPDHPQPALEEIQAALGSPRSPLRIECYDISNLQGTEVVASMVVFEDGLARKSEYRRFVIQGVDGQNDVASMHEVITRRFRGCSTSRPASATGRPTSDGPMLVDPETGRPRKFAYAPGWSSSTAARPRSPRPQRRSTSSASTTSRVRAGQALEEVWLPARRTGDPWRSSEGLYLLQRIRDEATASDHPPPAPGAPSRWSRACSTTSPALARCAQDPVKHFGSLKKLRADVDQIAQVPASARARALRSRTVAGRGRLREHRTGRSRA
jgi:excinuclease ABC subunit C